MRVTIFAQLVIKDYRWNRIKKSKKVPDLCAARHAVSIFAKFVTRRITREFRAKRKEKQRRLRSAGGVKRERKLGAILRRAKTTDATTR